MVTGNYTKESALNFFKELLSYSKERNISKVLIDARSMEGNMTTWDMMEYTNETITMALDYIRSEKGNRLRLAYLNRQELKELGYFGETVAINRGIAFAKVTTDIEEAMEWLGIQK